MIRLGDIEKWETWSSAGAELLLAPLSLPDKVALEAAARRFDKDTNGTVVRVYTDVAKYAQLVGRKCIKGWRPIEGQKFALVDARTGEPLQYTQEAAELLMTVGPASDFVISKVEGLSIWLATEVEAAGKG